MPKLPNHGNKKRMIMIEVITKNLPKKKNIMRKMQFLTITTMMNSKKPLFPTLLTKKITLKKNLLSSKLNLF